MELVVFITLLIMLAILALLFGHDSRERLSSNEEQQFNAGMRW